MKYGLTYSILPMASRTTTATWLCSTTRESFSSSSPTCLRSMTTATKSATVSIQDTVSSVAPNDPGLASERTPITSPLALRGVPRYIPAAKASSPASMGRPTISSRDRTTVRPFFTTSPAIVASREALGRTDSPGSATDPAPAPTTPARIVRPFRRSRRPMATSGTRNSCRTSSATERSKRDVFAGPRASRAIERRNCSCRWRFLDLSSAWRRSVVSTATPTRPVGLPSGSRSASSEASNRRPSRSKTKEPLPASNAIWCCARTTAADSGEPKSLSNERPADAGPSEPFSASGAPRADVRPSRASVVQRIAGACPERRRRRTSFFLISASRASLSVTSNAATATPFAGSFGSIGAATSRTSTRRPSFLKRVTVVPLTP